MRATFRPVADTGLLVAFGTTLDPDAHAAVLALDRALSDAPPDGLKETSPAMGNLMVVFDPLITDAATMQSLAARTEAVKDQMTIHWSPGLGAR